jgi:hypothetical protein
MRKEFLFTAAATLALAGAGCAQQAPQRGAGTVLLAAAAAGQPATGHGPTIAGCPAFPADNVWNSPVDKIARHPLSDKFVATIGADKPLHPDFGPNADIGIPFNVVPGDQKRVPVKFAYREETDLSNYPIPPNVLIEHGGRAGTDRHILLVDKDNCVLWEIFDAEKKSDGSWAAGSGAIFDLTCNCMRPNGWTSADAAGLPIFPGLVRYEEVAAGEIRHAIRVSVPKTRADVVWPALHAASKLKDEQYPPMGQRFRLKASVDISGFPREAQIILRALKTYGMIVADNGSPWFITGAPDSHWNDAAIGELKRIKGSDFEAVEGFDLFVTHHSTRARQVK